MLSPRSESFSTQSRNSDGELLRRKFRRVLVLDSGPLVQRTSMIWFEQAARSRTVSKLVGHSGVCGRQKRSKCRASELRHRSPGFPQVSLSVTIPGIPTRFSVRRGRVHCVRRNACEVVLRRSWSGRRLASPPAAALHFAGPQFFHSRRSLGPVRRVLRLPKKCPRGVW